MSAQDRISQLCDEALASPQETRKPAPPQVAAALAKFMLTPEAGAAEEPPAPAPAAKPEPMPTPDSAVAEGQKPQSVKPVGEDPELRAMLEERDAVLKVRAKRRRLVANCIVLLVFGGTAAAFVVSPTLRGKLDTFVFHLQGGVEDVKSMKDMAGSYDEAMAGVAQRGAHIDDATAALGVDPASVSEDEDPHMQAELDAMMGEGNRTVGERNASLKGAGKLVTAVTGRDVREVGEAKE